MIVFTSISILYFQNRKNFENEESLDEDIFSEKEQVTSYLYFQFDNKEIVVELEDNLASKEFIKMVPLTISFEDYNHTEKIAYLLGKLKYDNSGFDPEIGDLAYFTPWGNLAFYYKDSEYYPSLVKLGTIIKGVEYLQEIDGKMVTITNTSSF